MRKPLFYLISFVLASATSLPAAAQMLDPTFTPSGIYSAGTVYSAVEQLDGKRVASGAFIRVNGTMASSISRFDATGDLDVAFQQNIGANATGVLRIRKVSNGQFLLTSSFLDAPMTAGGITRQEPMRLNADGTGDASFDVGTGASMGGSSGYVDDILPLPNGQTIAVGYFDRFNGTPAGGIVRLTATGAMDPSFPASSGVGPNQEIETIAALPNGQLLIGGYFTSYNGVPCNGLARLNADGSLDLSFSHSLIQDSEVNQLIVQADGNILLAGNLLFSTPTVDRGIARLLPDGMYDPSFDAATAVTAGSLHSISGDVLQVQPDNKVLFIRALPSQLGTNPLLVGRLNADGSLDATFQTGDGPNVAPRCLTLLSNGKVLVGGSFTNYNGTFDRTLLHLSSTGNLETQFQPTIQAPGSVNAIVRQPDGKLIAGGTFSEISGQVVRRLARFNTNGVTDAAFTSNLGPETVIDVVLQADGRILAATPTSVRRYLSSGALDNSLTTPDFSDSRLTSMLLQPDGHVLVGGNPTSSTLILSSIVRLLPSGLLDTSFAPVNAGAGSNTICETMVLQPDGKLLVAGTFRTSSGTSIRTVMRLGSTGATDASFSGRAFSTSSTSFNFLSLAVQPDGKVLVGGRFSAYDGSPRSNIARLTSNGALDAGFVPPTISGTVYELAPQPNNRVLVGGAFTGSGIPTNLARLLPDGQSDTSFGANVVPDNLVRAVLVQPDGNIIVGGAFATLGGQQSPALARVTASNVLHVAALRAVADRTAIWPVPAQSALHVAPDAGARPLSLDLLDAMGRPVLHQLLSGPKMVKLAIESLPPGTYVLRVTYQEGSVTRRIQVQ